VLKETGYDGQLSIGDYLGESGQAEEEKTEEEKTEEEPEEKSEEIPEEEESIS
jgi:hypothetical protein